MGEESLRIGKAFDLNGALEMGAPRDTYSHGGALRRRFALLKLDPYSSPLENCTQLGKALNVFNNASVAFFGTRSNGLKIGPQKRLDVERIFIQNLHNLRHPCLKWNP